VSEFGGDLGDTLWFHNVETGANFRHDFSPKITLSLGSGANYVPYYRYVPFLQNTLTEESPAGQDYGFAAKSDMVRGVSASASIEDRFTRRSSVSFGATWDRFDVPETPELSLERRGVRGTVAHNILKKLRVHAGYGVEEIRHFSDTAPTLNHVIDIGLGYGDGLTVKLGRYYTLSMGVGASVMRNGDPESVLRTGKSTAFALDGHATLSRSLGQSWGASIGYRQGTQYVLGFREPVYGQSASAGLGGPLFSRLQFSAGAGASRGQQVFSENGTITAYNASTRLSYAVWSNMSLYGQASYYRYSIPFDFDVLGFVPGVERRSVSVGLSTWIPFIKPPRNRRGGESGQP
jgi:hypothetical protein